MRHGASGFDKNHMIIFVYGKWRNNNNDTNNIDTNKTIIYRLRYIINIMIYIYIPVVYVSLFHSISGLSSFVDWCSSCAGWTSSFATCCAIITVVFDVFNIC